MPNKYVGHGPYKFAEGGEVTEGANVNIDDETRARALEMVKQRMALAAAGAQAEEPAAPPPRRAAPPAAAQRRAIGATAPYSNEGRNRPAPQQVQRFMGKTPQAAATPRAAPAERTSMNAIAEDAMARRAARGMAAGGSIDGCASRGKTRAKRG
jgi:hypothetical protein